MPWQHRAAPGVYIVSALGRRMRVQEGQLLALHVGAHRMRPARLIRVNRDGGLVVAIYDEAMNPARRERVRTVQGRAILGYWQ
jgi:hypothetical protein